MVAAKKEPESLYRTLVQVLAVVLTVFGSEEVIDIRAASRAEKLSQENQAILKRLVANQDTTRLHYDEILTEIRSGVEMHCGKRGR